MEIDVSEEEILVVHRKGSILSEDQDRPMLVHCQCGLKERIFKNAKNLKDKENDKGNKFYVNKQVPDVYAEQNREVRDIVHDQKDKDSTLPPKEKSRIEVKNKQVYIDGVQVEKQLLPPEPLEILVDKQEREKFDKIKFAVSDTAMLQGSDFIAFAMKTGQFLEVKRAYRKIKGMHSAADHIMAGYNLRMTSGYQVDGELGRASKIVKYLKDNKPLNMAVFIVRYKNGKNIGLMRFEIIEQVVQQATSRLH